MHHLAIIWHPPGPAREAPSGERPRCRDRQVTTWDVTGSASTSAAPSPTSASSTRRRASSPASSRRPCPAIPAAASSTGCARWWPSAALDPGEHRLPGPRHHDRRQHRHPAERGRAGPPGHRRVRRRPRDPAAPPREPRQLHGDAPRAADPALPRRRGHASASWPTAPSTPRSTARSSCARRPGWSSGRAPRPSSSRSSTRTGRRPTRRRRGRCWPSAFPDLHVTCSHEVWPQIREYERTMVAILSAYVRPRVDRYLEHLERELGRRRGAGAALHHEVQRRRDDAPATPARRRPRRCCRARPRASSARPPSASAAGYRNLITFDMGGTSADIALVRDGQPVYSTDETVGDFPIVMPVVGVSSIGAGGGSIAWLDSGRRPQGRPAERGRRPRPGVLRPGRDASRRSPTPSSLCGFLNPDNFVGGRLRLHPDRAAAALRPLGEALGLDVDAAAEAVVEVATANMYAAFSNVLARHGLDPRDFALVAFGGAGPVEACFLAEEFHIPRVIVPPSPGTLCAQGAMTADVKSDYVRTLHRRLSATSGQAPRRASARSCPRAPGAGSPRRRPRSSASARRLQRRPPLRGPGVPGRGADRPGLARGRRPPTGCGRRSTTATSGSTPTPTAAADVELIDLRATITGTTPKPRAPAGAGRTRPGDAGRPPADPLPAPAPRRGRVPSARPPGRPAPRRAGGRRAGRTRPRWCRPASAPRSTRSGTSSSRRR